MRRQGRQTQSIERRRCPGTRRLGNDRIIQGEPFTESYSHDARRNLLPCTATTLAQTGRVDRQGQRPEPVRVMALVLLGVEPRVVRLMRPLLDDGMRPGRERRGNRPDGAPATAQALCPVTFGGDPKREGLLRPQGCRERVRRHGHEGVFQIPSNRDRI